jgi:CxxC motif-containing protein (DUF1111 family)
MMSLKALACTSLACACPFVSLAAPLISQQQRFQHSGKLSPEASLAAESAAPNATEAPTGFDNLTNGLTPQGPAFDSLAKSTVAAGRSFNENRFLFEQVEEIGDGLGPTFNGRSCGECHENVVTGGASQIAEHRTGRMSGQVFFESLGGSLIQSRGTHPEAIEHVAFEDDVSTFRISTNTLGAGFVESITNETLLAIRDAQPAEIRGTAVMVPVLEADSAPRIGRFGWKSQHASLESFSADAYLNEMGITNPLFPEENTANGRDMSFGSGYDPVAEPEDDGQDIVAFASFMRSTKAPARGEITDDARAGEQLFHQVGCDACHVTSITTGRAGTNINGGQFKIPPALGDKIIHPYSDFLLHDIGSGDGIPVLPTPEYANTLNQIRTAPLWGLRTRNRLMHDGLSFTQQEAIARHGGQAEATKQHFNALSAPEQRLVLMFLESL